MNYMDLRLKPREECLFDQMSLGEVLLRFDPGESRVRCARNFHVWECGGEYNVARALTKAFGLRTSVVTAIARNDIGELMKDCIQQGGVDVSHIIWRDYDGVGKSCRNPFVFTERGYGIRGALSVSDRGHSAAALMRRGEVDWDDLFGRKGCRWLHTGGIFAALSPSTAEMQLEAVQKAKEYNVRVSYDLNYRASLWNANGGLDKARQLNREMAKYVDIMIGNEEDFTNCLGYRLEEMDGNFLELNNAAYKNMVQHVMTDYPNLSMVATTMRTVKTATVNGWKAICYVGGRLYESMEFENLEVQDRVGGGDGFASGLIYSLLNGFDIQSALDYGVAHGALVQTTPGDTSMANVEEVKNIVEGKGARIVR